MQRSKHLTPDKAVKSSHSRSKPLSPQLLTEDIKPLLCLDWFSQQSLKPSVRAHIWYPQASPNRLATDSNTIEKQMVEKKYYWEERKVATMRYNLIKSRCICRVSYPGRWVTSGGPWPPDIIWKILCVGTCFFFLKFIFQVFKRLWNFSFSPKLKLSVVSFWIF